MYFILHILKYYSEKESIDFTTQPKESMAQREGAPGNSLFGDIKKAEML